MIEKLTKSLMAWCEKHGRVFEITGTAGPDDVYLIRYYVVRSKWFNLFIHQFLRSDRDDLHDHPWHFVTYLVKGAYTENKWNEKTQQVDSVRRKNYPMLLGFSRPNVQNRLIYRKATDQHQVVVDNDLKREQKDQASLTLCLTGPTVREWGFIKEVKVQNDGVTPISEQYRPLRTWIPWREYLGLPKDAKGRG